MSETDITIPPKALKAAVRTHMNLNLATREEAMRAACLAMLREWPGMGVEKTHIGVSGDVFSQDIILPLPKENSDDISSRP